MVRSTGLCTIQVAAAEPIRCSHVTAPQTVVEIQRLMEEHRPAYASIDGPLVMGTRTPYKTINHYRRCEQILSRGVFQKRCKPGPTNSPRGRDLHHQATAIANHVSKRFPGIGIVEAFPNAFLGVMLPDEVFREPIRRGIKSDVFWNYCVNQSNLMSRLLSHLFERDGKLLFDRCRQIHNHDERAAFICAMTARGTHIGEASIVAGGQDGAIALPPRNFLQPWARTALAL